MRPLLPLVIVFSTPAARSAHTVQIVIAAQGLAVSAGMAISGCLRFDRGSLRLTTAEAFWVTHPVQSVFLQAYAAQNSNVRRHLFNSGINGFASALIIGSSERSYSFFIYTTFWERPMQCITWFRSQTRIRDPIALATACARLKLPCAEPSDREAKLSDGLAVEVPGWQFQLFADVGQLRYADDFGGRWGDIGSLMACWMCG